MDSPATGNYDAYLMREVLPFAERLFRVSRWGVFGKSSGGYGAFMLGLRHPDVFVALADHSGDAGFELCYLSDFPEALSAFQAAGGPKAWLARIWADANRHRDEHEKALNVLGMAAHYSPDPSCELGIAFPFDLETGAFRPEVWERWRAHDPVNLVAAHADALRQLRLVYVDCGAKDEFGLFWGARALVARLRGIGVEPLHEEFDDGHFNISYRYDVSVPKLVRALAD
jgi:S-formylglutathione hydrolase FrmB